MYSILTFFKIFQCLSVEYSPCPPSLLCSFYCIFVFFPHAMESYPFSLRKICYFDEQGLAFREWCQNPNTSRKSQGINCSTARTKKCFTSCKELTHWKRLWCWEGLGAGGEGDDRGWDGWMVSLTRWTWVWVNSGSWWWTGRPGVLRFMGSQRVGHDWATELNKIFIN